MKVIALAASAATVASLLVISSPVHASTTIGEDCPKVGQVKSGSAAKGRLMCLKVAGIQRWAFVPGATTAQSAQAQIRKWVQEPPIPNEDVIRLHLQHSPAYVQQRLAQAQADRDMAVQQLASAQQQETALTAEQSDLPSRVAQAAQASKDAEAKLAGPKAAYTSAASNLSRLDSELARLETSRAAHLACKILEMFGMGGPCGPSNDSYYFSIKSQHSSATSQANAAWATYSTLYNDYKAKYDAYKALFDRQNAIGADLAALGAQQASFKTAVDQAEGHLQASHEVNSALTDIAALLAQYDSAKAQLTALADKKLPSAWEGQFNQAARLRGVMEAARVQLAERFAEFRMLTPDLPDPLSAPDPVEPTPEPAASGADSSPAAA